MFFLNNHTTAVQKKRDVWRKRVMASESLKCQLTSCEKNQNTERQCEYNKGMRPGWPLLWKLWHIETTSFKKLMTNLRKWKKLSHVPRFPTSTVKPKSYGDKTQMSFVCCLLSHMIVEFPNSRHMYALRTYFFSMKGHCDVTIVTASIIPHVPVELNVLLCSFFLFCSYRTHQSSVTKWRRLRPS